MTDDASDFFRFLTNSYLSEPTPENAQRLWRAVFALEGLYFLLREMGGDAVPAIALQDGGPHLLVWTDLDSLREYVYESEDEEEADGEPHFLFARMPKVVETMLRFEQHGVEGIRFNAPLGWSVPLERMKIVAQHFGVAGI
jgi:hypothetical protein